MREKSEMNLREAAQQALEALENLDEQELATGDLMWLGKEIGALRVALAEDAMQRLTDVQQEMEAIINEMETVEPVAWMRVDRGHVDFHRHPGYLPLYTAPPKRKPLLIERNEFIGDPPAPAKTWGEYFENVVTTSRLSGLRVSALTNPVAHEFAGVKITEVRLPENMAMRLDGDVLVIERAHEIGGEE